MAPRNPQLMISTLREPFSGYALRPAWALRPDIDRVMACVALLGVMLLSGVALGSPDHSPRHR